MFIEKRKVGKSIKYYLVHSFRDKYNKVVKLRHYLGTNLTEKSLEKLSKRAEEILKEQIKETKTSIFDFSLTQKQIDSLNKYDDKIKIHHFSEKEWQQFTEEFVFNTNAIEGSKILHEDIHEVLERKNPRNFDEMEAQGVEKAINFIRTTKEDLSIKLLLKLHKLCFEKSKHFAGKLRKVEVVIRGKDGSIIHRGTPPGKLKNELDEFIKWYKKNKKTFKPLALAGIIHNQFEDIHPFEDGNGRVGRLLLNFILLKNNYPPINILLIDRAEYYYVLQKYQKEDEFRPTLKFLIKQYNKTLKQVTTKKRK